MCFKMLRAVIMKTKRFMMISLHDFIIINATPDAPFSEDPPENQNTKNLILAPAPNHSRGKMCHYVINMSKPLS